VHLDRITRRSLGERIKQRRMQVYYVCKKKIDSATAGGGFDEIEDFYKSSQRDNQQQN
jgi:hypothetical protein